MNRSNQNSKVSDEQVSVSEAQTEQHFPQKQYPYSKDKMAALWAWLICPTVVLLSYMPVLNLVARGVFVVFIVWFSYRVFLRRKRGYWLAPAMIYLIWGLYSLGISIFALNVELSIHKWATVFLLGVLTLASANAVIWSGSIRPWAWAYVVAIMLSVISNYLPIQEYLVIDYETETLGRTVGTLANANTYGRAMVQGSFVIILLLFHINSKTHQRILLIFLGILGLAVMQSGSRTAFIGYTLIIAGGIYCAGWAIVTVKNLLLSSLIGLGGVFVIVANPERFISAFERMKILLAYFGLIAPVATKEQSLVHREQLMEHAWDVWLNHPMGVGFDNYQLISGVYAHSNYFELLASVGLLGLILYYCSYWILYRKVLYAKRWFTSPSQYKIIIVFIVVMLAMDISNVSYYSKPLWLLIGIVSGYIYLTALRRWIDKTE